MVLQAESNSLQHWMSTNAPAAWIAAAVSLTAFLLQLRKRPRRLVLIERGTTSLTRVPDFKTHKVEIKFDDRAVKSLALARYDLHNEGTDPISDATFNLEYPAGSIIVHAALGPTIFEKKCWKATDNKLTVTIPYLNSIRDHKQELSLFVMVDGQADHAKVSGGGEGWSLRLSPLPTDKQVRRWRNLQLASLVTLALLSIPYLRYVHRFFGLQQPDISLKAFAVDSPIVVLAFLLTFVWDQTVRRLHRL